MNPVANNLLKIRKDKGMSKEELSRDLHIPILHIDGYENKTKVIPPDVLIKYSEYFSVSIDYICGIVIDKNKRKISCEEFSYRLSECFKKNKIDVEKLTSQDLYKIVDYIAFMQKYKFTDEEFRVIYSLMKIMNRCNYKEEHLEGLIEMLDILDLGAKSIIPNDKLYIILGDIKKLII